MITIEDLPELGCRVVASIDPDNDASCSFKAYKIYEGYDPDEEPFLDGSVKWDGCSNWYVLPDHFCSMEEARSLGELFEYIYNKAEELIPGYLP